MSHDANEYIIERLQEVSAYEMILNIFVVILIIGMIGAVALKAWRLLEKYRTVINDFEQKNKLIKENQEEIKEHQEEIQELYEADKDFMQEFEKVYNKIDKISEQLTDMQERNDARERADIKSHISALYQKFHEKQCWSEMEKESMEGLIAAYEECGGENSFIHDIVQKDMYIWKIVS